MLSNRLVCNQDGHLQNCMSFLAFRESQYISLTCARSKDKKEMGYLICIILYTLFCIAAGSGGAVQYSLDIQASNDQYSLPVGTYPITLEAENCAGTAQCTTFVTVTDAETFSSDSLSCGQLPANGILQTSVSSGDTVYSPSYTKANGCPVKVLPSNLVCQNCLLGSSNVAEGGLDKCASTISSKGVTISSQQKARVKWTVTGTDSAGNILTEDCAVCVQDSALLGGKCPSPFSATSACTAGFY